ncbi:MAG TPA: NHLP family bacteriocin export ABC transporter peptidase/permease/ATPase subunit [Stellaceae bacterium]|nr:NHLP family bacteriocin export ABC transporter peptidase/permease/ATPase subunit [Stellaceae bacterium]
MFSRAIAALRLWGGTRRKRHRAPTVLQMEAVECGAASLAMVLAYYGRWVPLEELRLACGVTRDGSKASNVLKAARQYGLAAKGFRKEPESLGDLPRPSIIHWNFNHFVVFEGLRRDWAYVNDPGIGPRRISFEELSEAFTGVVLAFEPGADFMRSGTRPRALPILWRQLAGSRGGLALVVAISLTLVLPGIVVPTFSKLFVDDVLIGGSREWVGPLLIGLALTGVLRALIFAFRQRYLLRLEMKLGLVMASRFVWHVLRLPIAFFTQRHAADIASRIAVNEEVARLLSGQLATSALHLAALVFFAAALAAYDVMLAAIAIGVALLNVAALVLLGRNREDTASRLAQDRGRLAAATVGLIRSIETIKSIGSEGDAFSRWSGFHAKAMDASQHLDRQTAVLGVIPPLLGGLGNAAILGFGCWRIMHGAMSVGDLVAFQTLAASTAEPVGRLVMLGASLQQIKADLFRVNDVLAYPVDQRTIAETSPILIGSARLQGEIELRGLTFGYNPNAPPMIEDFDLVARPGQRIAIVGGSGSGKSTVGRLICGLYPAWSGDILFDGRPIGEISPEVLANSLSYVDQDVFLFADTVRGNLTLWDDSVEEARLVRALHDASMFDEIAGRPGLSDYRIAEGGSDFSGGQRQRLEIARALIGEPAILVLDEATAALDPVVEEEIDANIRRRGCTCIIIAHRYSTIRDCDEIVVLSEGRVAGRGTHPVLMEECPEYRALLEAE